MDCKHERTRYIRPFSYRDRRWWAECLACGREMILPTGPTYQPSQGRKLPPPIPPGGEAA